MSGDDYGQAFHDGETAGAAEERRAIVAWLRAEAAKASGPISVDAVGSIQVIADAIERGAHAPTEPSGKGEEKP